MTGNILYFGMENTLVSLKMANKGLYCARSLLHDKILFEFDVKSKHEDTCQYGGTWKSK